MARAGDDELLRTRALYYKASADKEDAERFTDYLSASPAIGRSLLAGYNGMAYMIRANYTWNPYNKLSYFNKGRDMLDAAISKDPSNLELRFLRFGVQTNAPAFLGYSGKIEEDKSVILKGYALLKDKDLKDRIKNYLAVSKYCNTNELALLK